MIHHFTMNFDLQEIFVENLKNYRKKAGFTQEALSEKLNKTMNYISKIECKMLLPSFKVIEEISSILKIEPQLLFSTETPIFTNKITEIAKELSSMNENKISFIETIIENMKKL